jgi:crossover junction endodeoxyribonuclease RusA
VSKPSEPLNIHLPFPPTVNTYYRTFRGRMLISKKGREYKKIVEAECLRQRVHGKRLACRLFVEVFAYPPDKRKRDLDNMLKPLLDSLAGAGVFVNDSQIDDLRIVRGHQDKPGKVVVNIWRKGDQ